MDGAYHLIIETYGKEVDAKAFFPLDIGIGVGMLIQVAHHGEKSCLIPVKAAPRMKAHIRFPVLLPGRDGKQNSGDSRRHFKMGKQVKFLRICRFKIPWKIFSDLDLHGAPPDSSESLSLKYSLNASFTAHFTI